MSLCDIPAAHYLDNKTLPPWYSKWVTPHKDCYIGQLESVEKCLNRWETHPWGAFVGPTGSGKSYLSMLSAQLAGLQLLVITAANALGDHQQIIREYASPDTDEDDAYSVAVSYDVLSFNNSTAKHNKEWASNSYLIYEDGEYRPTKFFKKVAKKYGWCLSIDEIQKTKNAINYSYAVQTLVSYIVRKFSRALEYDEDDQSDEAKHARAHAKSRVVYSSFCAFDDVKQLKTFCWVSGIFDELPDMDTRGKKFLRQIQPLIDLAENHKPKRTKKLVDNLSNSKAARYKLIYELTHIVWKYIAIPTVGLNLPYKVRYYDMFYQIPSGPKKKDKQLFKKYPKGYRHEAEKILRKIERMNKREGNAEDRLISELKKIEELMVECGIYQELSTRLLKDDTRVLIGMDFNGYINHLQDDLNDEGYDSKIITGAVASARRKKISDEFRAGDFDALIINKDAGAEGIGFHNTSDANKTSAAISMADFKFQKNVQFSGRLVRLGMVGDVTIISLYPYLEGAEVPTLLSIVKSMKKKMKAARPFMQDDLGVIKLPGEYTAVDKNFKKITIEA